MHQRNVSITTPMVMINSMITTTTLFISDSKIIIYSVNTAYYVVLFPVKVCKSNDDCATTPLHTTIHRINLRTTSPVP